MAPRNKFAKIFTRVLYHFSIVTKTSVTDDINDCCFRNEILGCATGRGTITKSVFDYLFNSNKHAHVFLFVTHAFWVFIARIWFGFRVQSGLFVITEWEPCV